MKNDDFLKEFDKSQFDADQIEQIRYGLVFDLDISVGDEVHAGELMGSIDLDFVKSKGKETVTPIVLTAMDEYKIEFVKTEGHVNIGDVLYKISK